MANSDRGLDRGTLSRDLLDLAALSLKLGGIPDEAWHKAESAYSRAVRDDLRKAARLFLDDAEYRGECFVRLDVTNSNRLLGEIERFCSG